MGGSHNRYMQRPSGSARPSGSGTLLQLPPTKKTGTRVMKLPNLISNYSYISQSMRNNGEGAAAKYPSPEVPDELCLFVEFQGTHTLGSHTHTHNAHIEALYSWSVISRHELGKGGWRVRDRVCFNVACSEVAPPSPIVLHPPPNTLVVVNHTADMPDWGMTVLPTILMRLGSHTQFSSSPEGAMSVVPRGTHAVSYPCSRHVC